MESDDFRKAIGNKDEDSLAHFKKKFIYGGMNNGYPKERLEAIWYDWYKNAVYLFNKSHAVCYTFIAYQMMYLKIHYPDEFSKVMTH